MYSILWKGLYIRYNKAVFNPRLTKEKEYGKNLDQRSTWSQNVFSDTNLKKKKQWENIREFHLVFIDSKLQYCSWIMYELC